MRISATAACLLAAWTLAPCATAAETPVLTEQVAQRLLQGSPVFSGAHAGRTLTRIVRMNHMLEGTQEGWGVEVQWKEGGRDRVGVAPIRRVLPGQERDPWLFQQDGWGVMAFVEDKTFEELQALVKNARIRANEAAALSDLRTILSGEMSYSSVNGGAYDELRCLSAPAPCLHGYSGPGFVDARTLAEEKNGYHRRLHAGPRAAKGPGVSSASSLTTFAWTAVPVAPGESGTRSFCGDDTGRICVTSDGSEPPTAGGRCADPCQVLR